MFKSGRLTSSLGLFSVMSSVLTSNVGVADNSVEKSDDIRKFGDVENFSVEKSEKEIKNNKICGINNINKKVIFMKSPEKKKSEEKSRVHCLERIGRLVGRVLGVALSMPISIEIKNFLLHNDYISWKNGGEFTFDGWDLFGRRFTLFGSSSLITFIATNTALSFIGEELLGFVGRGIDSIISWL